jgi:hypothetical protein
MIESNSLKGISLCIVLTILFACSSATDIENEKDVMSDLQGNWTGRENLGNMYRHMKLKIVNNLFEAWVQTSDSQNEPVWASIPDEKGAISLNSIQNDPESNLRFRKFSFTCAGRCCGDKSFSLKTISELISYDEGKGLTMAHKIGMLKEKM